MKNKNRLRILLIKNKIGNREKHIKDLESSLTQDEGWATEKFFGTEEQLIERIKQVFGEEVTIRRY